LIASLEQLAAEAQLDAHTPARATTLPDLKDPGLRFVDLLASLDPIKSGVLDQIAAASEARLFLAREALALSPEGRQRFLGAVLDELIAATALLHRRAKGDYSTDPRLPVSPNGSDLLPAHPGDQHMAP
jgi:hypothetical protein